MGNLYEEMARRNELITTPGRTVDIATFMHWALSEYGRPDGVVCDRHRIDEFKDGLEAVGIGPQQIIPRGMGFIDGSEDVRAFQRAVKERLIQTPVSLVARAAFSGAVTVSDPAGNEKLAKGGQGGRRVRHKDDFAAAAIVAVSAGVRHWREEPEPAASGLYEPVR